MGHYGIGALTAVAIVAELGDTRRFSSSRQAVRYAGLDITVHESDRRRAPGHLSPQGPPVLRWALYEAAQVARRPSSPDRAYYDQAAERLGGCQGRRDFPTCDAGNSSPCGRPVRAGWRAAMASRWWRMR